MDHAFPRDLPPQKKIQITILAAIANHICLKRGSRIDWQQSSTSDEIRSIALPEPSVIAASLRGDGKRYLKPGQNPQRCTPE